MFQYRSIETPIPIPIPIPTLPPQWKYEIWKHATNQIISPLLTLSSQWKKSNHLIHTKKNIFWKKIRRKMAPIYTLPSPSSGEVWKQTMKIIMTPPPHFHSNVKSVFIWVIWWKNELRNRSTEKMSSLPHTQDYKLLPLHPHQHPPAPTKICSLKTD